MAGETTTGATTFELVRELDAGPVYRTTTEPIAATDTAADLLGRLAVSGARLLADTLAGIEAGERPVAQPAAARTEGAPLSVEDYIKDVVLRYQDTHSEIALAAMLGIGRKALWVRRRNWGLYRERDPHARESNAPGPYEKAS